MISIIIPTFNEEQALPATLRSVFKQPGDYEVIIVDGGSTDRTPAIAAAQSGPRLLHAPKGRASQMNMGAGWRRANGCFSSMPIPCCPRVPCNG